MMARSLRAELLKLVTTRAICGLLVGEMAAVLLVAGLTAASTKTTSLTGPSMSRRSSYSSP
jgi:hypothetical protein